MGECRFQSRELILDRLGAIKPRSEELRGGLQGVLSVEEVAHGGLGMIGGRDA